MKYLLLVALALVACGDPPKFSLAKLQDPNTCKECHEKHYDQWSGSMHAYASDDPVFLAMNKRGQRETNGALGDFCIKCHAPMAIKLGLATGANFDPTVLPPEARGITCFFCHNVKSVEDDHNNGLVLAMDQTMRGGAKHPVDNPAHDAIYDPMMASKTNNSVMCGSCHDVLTDPPASVHLERTYEEWKTTIFALDDPTAFLPATCSKCHMQPSKDVIADAPGLAVTARDDGFHDHEMAGIDQALTPFPRMTEQRAAIDKILKPSLGIVGVRSLISHAAPGGICLDPTNGGELSVRIDSLSPGHMFPSGAAQDRRVWLEVIAYDASNNVLFQRGVVPDGTDPDDVNDPSLQCATGNLNCATFFDRTYTADGSRAHFFWDVARYDSNLIRPPITRDSNSPAYDHSTTVKYSVGAVYTQIDRIEAKIYVRALPFGAIDALISSGDLDPSIRTQLAQPEATMLAATSTWLKSTKGTGEALNTNCNPF